MFKRLTLAAAALLCATAAIAADAWPTRPITLVVPGAAGGSTDIPARLLALRLGERLGQPVIVDNRPGAGGSIGAGQVARAQPDGYTVLVGNTGSNAINYTAYKKLPYKPEDFVALTDMISFCMCPTGARRRRRRPSSRERRSSCSTTSRPRWCTSRPASCIPSP
jgi:tripartite-type tricarboxylate transporter receptor subunit TctC